MQAGFHLMLHGVGSKRAIMEELGERLAAYGDVIHADGATDIVSALSSSYSDLVAEDGQLERAS